MHRSGYILVFIKYSAYVQFFLSFGLLSALMLIKWGSNFQNAYIYIYIYIYIWDIYQSAFGKLKI